MKEQDDYIYITRFPGAFTREKKHMSVRNLFGGEEMESALHFLDTTDPEEIAKQTELLRTMLLWLSQHPELTPIGSILGKYVASRAFKMCLGPNMCHHCESCLGFFGIHLEPAGLHEIMTYALDIAYQQALKNPVQSLHMAVEGIHFVTHAIDTLAHLPENADTAHKELAKILLEPQSSQMSKATLLQEGMKIYNKHNGLLQGDWLHVGLPQILEEVHKSVGKLKAEDLQKFINDTYQSWRSWGQRVAPLLKNTKDEAVQKLLHS